MKLDSSPPGPNIGWPLLLLPDEKGQLHYPDLTESVRQNLRVMLSTRNGEQLMRPEYGAGLLDFIGAPDTISTRQRIHDRITEAIGRWEPRILLDRVEVLPTPDRPGRLRIEIAYRLRRTGEALSLGVNVEL